ncbi:hypothetical protein AUJ46_05445 [Candidatus Peregrinibacteria bacterium CG1_02_54_53]|nr:MAG: hypothetical protein AUJ46_05445 [Candidatus Peregrinibacteria bacterium CG1_02_54_53]
MAKKCDRFPIGEPEVSLTFRTSRFPIGDEENQQLDTELRKVLDDEQCDFSCSTGEVCIRRMSYDYAAMIRGLLEGREVLRGTCELNEQ